MEVTSSATGPLCCQGKNNSCVAYGSRLNSAEATTCFCDANCLTTGDCCSDYIESCPAVDCETEEEWGEWGECDAKCGPGQKRRHRAVVRGAQNGGRPCLSNNTVQTAPCVGTSCKVQRASDRGLELTETGRIIPAAFATWRQDKLYSPFQDIRKNLFEHYGDPTAVNRPTYCATYELVDVHSTCRKMAKSVAVASAAESSTTRDAAGDDWLSRLVKGVKLCVECQSFAMQRQLGGRCRGHGVLERQTSWKAVTVPGCHGKWKLVSKHTEQCTCNPRDRLSFTFV